MLLKDFYENIRTYSNTDGTDNYFGLDDFNRSIGDFIINFTKDVLLEEKNVTPDEKHMSNHLLSYENGYTPYNIITPSDFLIENSFRYIDINNNYYPVKLVSYADFTDMMSNFLMPPINENYITYKGFSEIYTMQPSFSNGTFHMVYYKKPETPFLDYYINSVGENIFLDVGESVSISGGSQYRDGTTSGTKISQTIELDIPDVYHERYMNLIIEKLGFRDRDQFATQYAIAKDMEDKS